MIFLDEPKNHDSKISIHRTDTATATAKMTDDHSNQETQKAPGDPEQPSETVQAEPDVRPVVETVNPASPDQTALPAQPKKERRGGYRPGAGRKPKIKDPLSTDQKKAGSEIKGEIKTAIIKKKFASPDKKHRIPKGEPVWEDGRPPSERTEGGSQAQGEAASQSSLGGNDSRSGGEIAGFHIESILGSTDVPLGVAGGEDQDGLEDCEQILSERDSGNQTGDGRGDDRPPSSSGEHSGAGAASAAASAANLESQLKMLRDPVRFCQTFCAVNPYVAWQRDFLGDCRVVDDLGQIKDGFSKNVVLAAVNGSGKTELLADLIRYLLATVPNCVIPISSHVERQLEQLHSYLTRQQHKFPGWRLIDGKLEAPNGNYARWFCAQDVGAVESFHAPFLVRILDEVKSMKDDVIDATNRWHPKLSIWVSSKGLMTGRFYESLTSKREHYRVHEVSAYDCPWISEQQIAEWKATLSPGVFKSMVPNEFNDVDVRNLITLEQINRCMKNPQPPWHGGYRVAGIDLSAAKKGGDECVCVARLGNMILEPYFVPPCGGEMEAVGLVVRWIKANNIRFAFIDNGGLGGPMADRMMEVLRDDSNVQLTRLDFGGKPIDKTRYFRNRVTELWSVLGDKIETRDLVFEWSETAKGKLISQLTSRAVETSSDGMIKLEAKEKMRSRGVRSPDLADAVALSLINPVNEVRPSVFGENVKDWAKFKDGDGSGGDYNFACTSSGYKLGRG